MRFLSVPFIVLLFSFHVPSLWFQKYFYFLVFAFLSCTFHFLSRLFHLPFTFMPCHFIENISNFCACSCQIMFIVLGSFHDLPCPFYAFFSSLLLPTFFYLTLLYFNAFHFLPLSFHVRFFHVLPLSVHILSLSLHVMSRISQIDYSECVTVAIVVVTLYRCENEKNQRYTHTKAIPFVFVPFPFHFCSYSFHAFFFLLSVSFHFLPCFFHFRQSYLCFTFTLFNFPPFLMFFHVLLMFL